MPTIEWIGKLMATTWDTYPLIYMGTIVLWLTIVCLKKHTQFPVYNKLATSWSKLCLVFENMQSHGKSIKPVFRQLIT